MSNEMQKFHLCNDVRHLIPTMHRLHDMYEDNDLEGLEEAEAFAAWLEEAAPGAFVLINTGDLIVPPCASNSDEVYRQHWRACETYDPYYGLYLVPASVWRDCSESVLAADAQWRREKNQCQLKSPEPLDEEERIERQAQAHLEATARWNDEHGPFS